MCDIILGLTRSDCTETAFVLTQNVPPLGFHSPPVPPHTRQAHFLMELRITSVHVGAFTREDGQAAPHSKFADNIGCCQGIDTTMTSEAGCCAFQGVTDRFGNKKLGNEGEGYGAEPGTGNDFMQLPVAVEHQFICFPSSVAYSKGWNGSYTAAISVTVEDGSRHALGQLKWMCFEDAGEWDIHRCQLDELELNTWAAAAGFREGEATGNWKCVWIQCPPAGFTPPSDLDSTMINLRQSLGIERVPTYLPIIDFVTGFAPKKRCSLYVLEDAARVLPGVLSLERVVEECSKIAASKLEAGIGSTHGLEPQELFAIVLYSFDLSLIMAVDTEEASKGNFYYQLNLALQTRSPEQIKGLRGYLFFLWTALRKLECVDGELFRGIRRESLPVLEEYYNQGRHVHWSGMTSTSTSFNVARRFAGHEGVVLRIAVRSGRKLGECSAMGTVEHEILLMANFKAAVVKELYRDDSSGVRCIDLLELSDDSAHVF